MDENQLHFVRDKPRTIPLTSSGLIKLFAPHPMIPGVFSRNIISLAERRVG